MARWGRRKLARLFLWLLVFLPVKPFYSERPYVAAQLPLTKGDLASSRPQPGVYLGLSCAEDHMNSTLARADVTRWLNPTVILCSLAKIVMVAVIIVTVVYVLVMASFWCCHLGVHWAISGQYNRPKINSKTQRSIIQVLLFDCGQTEVATVYLDSPGRTLYRTFERRSGLPEHQLILMHGATVIRHSPLLGEQGIHHLSSIFVLPVMGKGGGKTRIDQKPTMPEMIAFQGKERRINIPEEIGQQWLVVGTILLDDKSGSIISAIARHHGKDIEGISCEILEHWLKGRDCTWRELLSVLRKARCTTLAGTIEEALTAEEAEQGDPSDGVGKVDSKDHHSSPEAAGPSHSDKPLLPPPFEPHSAVGDFHHYLKSFYSHPRDPVATWPPSPSRKFINLAVVNREEMSSAELREFKFSTLHKGADASFNGIKPVTMEQLMDTRPDHKLQCILMEGAPGIGKTTLSWEICKRWAEGALCQRFVLILLLHLRDESVQSATTVRDLILYPYEEKLDEKLDAIERYLTGTNGERTLIILDGLNDLPQHLLTQPSIFTLLLAGRKLPDATLLVTSRPSATAHLWKKWKSRLSKHIEVIGFTDENITAYVASILSPPQLPNFDMYICASPSIRQLMRIPLFSGIVIELYRMCRGPTKETALFTALIQVILTRYLAMHPKYKDHDIDVDKFTDLPDDVYHDFMNITKLAYEGSVHKQMMFEDKDRPIQHLGLMDAIVELFPNKRNVMCSYIFLHRSIQAYLGAIYLSQMDINSQEQLLVSVHTNPLLKNTAMFLAAITKFKGMDQDRINRAIQSECKERGDTLTVSRYALKVVYESENIELLEGHALYSYNLSERSPLFDFTALGYCIATSSYKWKLLLGNQREYLSTASGVDLLLHALHHGRNNYTIDSILCCHKETEIAQRLLAGLPQNTFTLLAKLDLRSETLQPLPECLPRLIYRVNRLCVLGLFRATAATLADTLRALSAAPAHALEELNLTGSQFISTTMQALHDVLLRNSESVTGLWLPECGLTDDQICLLITALVRLPKLRHVDLKHNVIKQRGHAALEEFKKYNKEVHLFYK